MKKATSAPGDKRQRFPPEIIGHAVWLYCRAAYGPIASHFRPRCHRLTAAVYRQTRAARFAIWRAVTGTPALA